MSVSNVVSRPVPDSSPFLKNLECPVKFTLLTDAVMLIPCGHTISEIAAKDMYRGMSNENGSGIAQTQGPCPLCCSRVTAYYPNYIIRSLVETTLGINLEETLPTTSAVVPGVEEINLDDIPFPGLGAKFVLAKGNWEILGDGCPLVRELCFVSETTGSLFHAMDVLGYRDGHVVIYIQFEKGSQTVPDYLLKCGIRNVSLLDRDTGKYYSDHSSNKLLFRILAKYNEIPADKFSLIRDLVASGNWNSVTPLRSGDRHRYRTSMGGLLF